MAIPAIAQYTVAVAIVPSDTVDISVGPPVPTTTDAIWVGGAGIVTALLQSGGVVNFTCVAGSLLPIKAKRVTTASTATLMVALYQ